MNLTPRKTTSATVSNVARAAWTLEIPPGPKGGYRLAQLDDYAELSRKEFYWQPPLKLSLRARVSQKDNPGTWGFGFWNDPFSLSLGFGGGTRKMPALPNAAWFFYGSSENYLSLRDDLPPNGFLAATFKSPSWPAALLAFGIPFLPLLAWTPTARFLRRLARQSIIQDSAHIPCDVTQWQQYTLTWHENVVSFSVNGGNVLETAITPKSPLGFILWIDNQFAALPPIGRLAYGTLAAHLPTSLDIQDLHIDPN